MFPFIDYFFKEITNALYSPWQIMLGIIWKNAYFVQNASQNQLLPVPEEQAPFWTNLILSKQAICNFNCLQNSPSVLVQEIKRNQFMLLSAAVRRHEVWGNVIYFLGNEEGLKSAIGSLIYFTESFSILQYLLLVDSFFQGL